MDEDLQNDPLDYTDPVIVKVPLKTPDDALDYWNHRLLRCSEGTSSRH